MAGCRTVAVCFAGLLTAGVFVAGSMRAAVQTVQGQLAALRSKIANGVNAPSTPKIETRHYGGVGCSGITFPSSNAT
jgi:hypothetical protein